MFSDCANLIASGPYNSIQCLSHICGYQRLAIDDKRLIDPCLLLIIRMYVYDDDDDDMLSCIII